MNKIIMILLTIIFLSFMTFACGSAVVPYVPTQGNANTTITSKFYILQKGVIAEMFNTKKLQPLFRNVILTGNQRKNINHKEKETQPVLNIHRLH